MKYTYHLECPCLGGWNNFREGTLGYCQGYLDAMRGQFPGEEIRLVRSDGRVMDSVEAHDDVAIGMVAGWPTAEQYEGAGKRALERAEKIRKNKGRYGRSPC